MSARPNTFPLVLFLKLSSTVTECYHLFTSNVYKHVQQETEEVEKRLSKERDDLLLRVRNVEADNEQVPFYFKDLFY